MPRWWEYTMHGVFMPGKDIRVPSGGWFSLSGTGGRESDYGKVRGALRVAAPPSQA